MHDAAAAQRPARSAGCRNAPLLPSTLLALVLALTPAPAAAQLDVVSEVPLDASAVEELTGTGFGVDANERPLVPRSRFQIDPVVDTTIMVMGGAFALFSELTINSGELRAQAPGKPENLLTIDRWVVEQGEIDATSGDISDMLLAGAFVAAMGDAVITSLRYDVNEGLATGLLYIESALVNWTLVNIVKLGVRRPRPRAYVAAAQDPEGEVDPETNSALSFYSGHTAVTAGIAATAAYMAFAREGPESWISWTVFGIGTAVSVAVAFKRVEAAAHFPTDVMAGWLFGAGVGVLVPHFHRVDPSVWSLDFFGNARDTAGVSLTHTF